MTVLDRPAPDSTDIPEQATRSDVGPWPWALLVASALGIVSGAITIVDKIALLKDPEGGSFCDIDARLGCTPALLASQSSVLGPPNAVLGIVMFAVLGTSGLVVIAGGRLSAGYRTAMVGLSVFFALFLTWYMQQMAFAIGSLCPFCTACAASVLVTVLATSRMAADPQGGRAARAMAGAARGGSDILVVSGWALLIAAMLYAGIWLG